MQLNFLEKALNPENTNAVPAPDTLPWPRGGNRVLALQTRNTRLPYESEKRYGERMKRRKFE